jgi:hypothetical protein
MQRETVILTQKEKQCRVQWQATVCVTCVMKKKIKAPAAKLNPH